MKSIIYTAACILTTLPSSLKAQSETIERVKTPKLVIGLQAGVLQSTNYMWGPYYRTNLYNMHLNAYGFVRYYMGKHFALETGFNKTLSGSVDAYNNGPTQLDHKTQITSSSVPLHLQYHLLKPESSVRPYFGIGIGIGEWHSYSSYNVINNGKEETMHDHYRHGAGYLQFTQGVTWQLDKRLQLNQSFTYRRGDLSGVGLNIGLGYTINK